MAAPLIDFRAYQRELHQRKVRRALALWRRQGGKSYELAAESLDMMMSTPGDLVTVISASIVLGTEILVKEARMWADMLKKMKQAAAHLDLQLTSNADGLNDKDFEDVFQHSKLETRLWFDNTTYSRSRVIAPNPDTAVGWTGHIIGDEIGRWENAKDVIEAIEPFMSSNPRFKLLYATTPPPDDKHYTFEMFQPDPGTEFTTNPRGNWYKSSYGIMVHRVDAWDAAAAGVHLYHPDSGGIISPEEHRRIAPDRLAWDRNYGVKFVAGGTSAVSLAALARAMEQGRGQCVGANITEEIAA